jgi:hypothetical protein
MNNERRSTLSVTLNQKSAITAEFFNSRRGGFYNFNALGNRRESPEAG